MSARGSVTPMSAAGERRAATMRVDGAATAIVETMRQALDGGAVTVTLDLAAVERLDARALGTLATAVANARAASVTVTFANARPAVYKALHVAKLV